MNVRIIVEFVRGDSYAGKRDPDRDFSEVEVTVDTLTEAHLTACQIVACRPGLHITRSLHVP